MEYVDQLNRTVFLAQPPQRIVSLVPSQTELLYDLGLGEKVVGQTIFCIHPHSAFKKATKIGGTKKLQLDKIRSLKPDLIVANKEENDQSQIETLAQDFPVWISDIITLDDALDMVKSIGMITDTSPIASRMIAEIHAGFSQFTTQNTEPKKVLYLIWNNPLMAVGQNTFINSVLNCAGFLNVISFQYSRYPEITETEIQALQPDFIFLSSEPFPFNKTHESYFQYLCPKAKILKTDGELMSWYGSRLLKTPPYLKSLMDYAHAK
ncbi:MAG: helical backbone metal receptor [Bacteroidia bacterium]|jgi:ABC-type Fe3+-hydroxamate transport system substrate-binding protein